MFNISKETQATLSIDCIRACPFRPGCFALAYYQTNPDTQGAIAVADIRSGEDLFEIKPIASPPLLHVVWCAAIARNDICLLVAASRTNDVLVYEYHLTNRALTLRSTLQVGEGIFCLYLDMQVQADNYRVLVSSN